MKEGKNNINYITIWENEYDLDGIDVLLSSAIDQNINTIVIDIRWELHESSEGNFDFTSTHKMCQELINRGFNVMPLISIFYCPAWVYEKYPEVREIDETLKSTGLQGFSIASDKSHELALIFIDKCISSLETFRDSITAISVSWNNEHETKFTQTHDLFRPYEKPAQKKFRSFIRKKNNSIQYWNDRWHTSFSTFQNVILPSFRGTSTDQIEQFIKYGQYLFDCYAFRNALLVNTYRKCCERIKSHKYKTWLHFGEMFTCIDAIYQNDVVFNMISEDWLDIVVIDTNLSKIGVEENDPFVAYIIVSACMQYNKHVIFELAVERDHSFECYKQSVKYALAKNLHGIGFTNIIQNANLLNHTENLLSVLDINEAEETRRVLDSRWHNRLLLIHPICGSLVLRQKQHVIGSNYIDPVQDCLMVTVKSWYDRGYDVNIIGDPKQLENINSNAYNEICFLEPIAMLTSDKKHITNFVEKLSPGKPYHEIKIDSEYIKHQTGFEHCPLVFDNINNIE